MPSLPTNPPFDLYDVAAGSQMGALLTYTGVTSLGSGITTDGTTQDQVLTANAGSGSSISISVTVPQSFTMEFTVKGVHLPPGFTDLVDNHVFLGSADPSGNCAGIFLSKVGLAYTGSVHLDGGGHLVVDTPVQLLPDSSLLIDEGDYYVYRIATDYARGATYIYATRQTDLAKTGHQLRYVLPAIQSGSAARAPIAGSFVSVNGTVVAPTQLFVDEIALGTGLIIPNLPPRADAGVDQATRTCSIVRFDGSASFDPEGAPLSYQWRLIDAPTGSEYMFDGLDGRTFPLGMPTGFTDHFYSSSLQTLNATSPILAGDVLVAAGLPYTITTTGTDGHGFFVQISDQSLPDGLPAGTAFKLLRQHSISNPTSVGPTFFPDVPGLYKFDLIVFDGNLYSLPSETIVNVAESPLPRGITPDMSFLWGYLSDFWKLLEDKERIEVLWGGMAQVAAAELLNLWQIEYSKSLRDVQRTWRRKWLRYALGMQEDPNFVEQTTVSATYGGVESIDIPTAGNTSSNGTHVDVTITATGVTYRCNFSGNPLTQSAAANQLAGQLQAVSPLFAVTQISNLAGTSGRVRIDAPFAFTISSATTTPLFTVGAANTVPSGTAGSLVGSRTYKFERSLQGLGIGEGDLLVLGGTAYRILRVISDPNDAFSFQRVTTVEDIPLGASATWQIPGRVTSKTLDFWKNLVTNGDLVTFEVVRKTDGQLVYAASTAFGACEALPQTLPVDTSPVGYYLSQPSLYNVYFYSLLRRQYIPIDDLVVDVPYLQEIINNIDDTQVLRRNVDFFLEKFRGANCMRFVVGANDVWQGGSPPDHMWAEMTYLDNRPTIEANFGIPADFTLDDLSQLPSNVDYLSTVRGLWYAYFNGPTVFNLRVGTQILLGLPFAEETGVITEIRNDFSSTTGRILVQDSVNTEIVRSYSYPASLSVETNPTTSKPYVVGDTVQQFAPLVSGVDVIDYVKDPTWFEGLLEQGEFYEVEKFFKFLVRADSAAFNLNALLFVQSFVKRIKPNYTFPIFTVAASPGSGSQDSIDVSDDVVYSGTLVLFEGAWTQVSGASMFDDPRASGGGSSGWWNQVDSNGSSTPTNPNANLPSHWGSDKGMIKPEHPPYATLVVSPTAGGVSPFDSFGYTASFPLYISTFMIFPAHHVTAIPAGATGYVIGTDAVRHAGSPSWMGIEIAGWRGTVSSFIIEILNNVGTVIVSETITKSASGRDFIYFDVSGASWPFYGGGETVSARIRTSNATDVEVHFHDLLIVLGNGSIWNSSTGVGAPLVGNTYTGYRSM